MNCNCGKPAKYTGVIIKGFDLIEIETEECIIDEPPFASDEHYCDDCLPEDCKEQVKEWIEERS